MSRFLLKIFALIIFSSLLIGMPTFAEASQQEAVFAGGCFWCLEHDLEDLTGVLSVDSGYSGGDLINPSYDNHQGHQEVVLVRFESNQISYSQLLRSYWRNVDPLDGQGQFCDRGDSYTPVIFTEGDNQLREGELSLREAARELSKPESQLKVKIEPRNKFWLAEAYHQDFASKNSLKYKFYRFSCGRDLRLEEIWGAKAGTDLPWGD